MHNHYPGYDVMAKRHTPSWNEVTRRVIDQRLAIRHEAQFFTPAEWEILTAVCDHIVPQPKDRSPIPVAAMVDNKMAKNMTDGYRDARLPPMQEAWQRGLHALDAEARADCGNAFHAIETGRQNALLKRMQEGELTNAAWGNMPCQIFFSERLLHDITAAYYAHPTAWNEIGFGGPASPRGYVRMGFNRRDAWEAAEARPDSEKTARLANRHE